MSEAALAWRLARRELRGGLKGFRLFLACLALGVAIVAAVGSLAAAARAGIAWNARALLGGDVETRLHYRPATDEQRRFLAAAGALSETRDMRAMASRLGGEGRALVELKGVDGAYPLYGAVLLEPSMPLAEALAERDGLAGTAVDPALLARLDLRLGERLRIGAAEFELRAALLGEPDRGAALFALGPRVLVSAAGLDATGLVRPGSLVHYRYRVRLGPDTDAGDFMAELKSRYPDAGWGIRGLDDAAPGVKRFVDRAALFLGLAGLGALLVGGIGVGNAVRSYLDGRIATIATLKCLGASGRLVHGVYLILILVMAAVGVALGLSLGALAPAAAGGVLGQSLRLAVPAALYPAPLAQAAAFGMLAAVAFSLWPLAEARAVPATLLFRRAVSPVRRRLGAGDLAAIAAAGAALAGLAVAGATDRPLAAEFVAGAGLASVAFAAAAKAVQAGARRVGRAARGAVLRLALANLHRPGAPTASVVLSLGLGLAILTAIGLVQGNIARQIAATNAIAPAFYFIDIQPDQAAAFDRLVEGHAGAGDLRRVPMLRGRIVAIDGTPVERIEPDPHVAWVLREDRGITWSSAPPPGARITAGEWWPADYRGPPLVSLDAEVAAGFGLEPGDSITVNVLGRLITGTIANLREVDWTTLNMNFVMVFSPGTLDDAPQTHIATVRVGPEGEAGLERAVNERFANVSAIRVREALAAVALMLDRIAAALGATAGLALVAGVLVLAGAILAGQRRRMHEAAVLKALGARRRQLVAAYAIEYGLLGLTAAALAAPIGGAGAYYLVAEVMVSEFVFLPGVAAGVGLLGAGAAVAIGLAGTWRALGAPVAGLLRNE